jgi:signal transduction histidine kinase
MASMGGMLGNIAHQWRQPLSAISTSASGILMYREMGIENKKKEEEMLENIVSKTIFLSDTIDSFKGFYSKDKDKGYFLIKDFFKNIESIVYDSLKSKEIKLKVSSNTNYNYYGYENELIQVFINIIYNSRDVLVKKDSYKEIFIKSYKNNEKIYFEISDNGGGIREDIIDKIFDPYFTTKHKSQGTGLGLHMSLQIIKESFNGEILAKNNKEGAVFKIILPINGSDKF